MYEHAPLDYVCPFCLIAKNLSTEIDGQEDDVVFRDDTTTAFISAKWWRKNPGHVIVIPNEHIENLYDMPESIGHALFETSKKIAFALKATYACDGISTRQHNEPAGGQSLWHYHQHVFPRYKGDDLYLNHKDTYAPSASERRPYADKLK